MEEPTVKRETMREFISDIWLLLKNPEKDPGLSFWAIVGMMGLLAIVSAIVGGILLVVFS